MTEPSEIPSPCTGVCTIDPRAGWCLGCRRTPDEIQQWPNADAAARRTILDRLAVRRAAG